MQSSVSKELMHVPRGVGLGRLAHDEGEFSRDVLAPVPRLG